MLFPWDLGVRILQYIRRPLWNAITVSLTCNLIYQNLCDSKAAYHVMQNLMGFYFNETKDSTPKISSFVLNMVVFEFGKIHREIFPKTECFK